MQRNHCVATRRPDLARHGRPRPRLLAIAGNAAPAAHASLFSGETLDAVANGAAWVVLFIAPLAAIGIFLIIHILPEKIAEKKQHPQLDAIKTLCLLSLVFGGMLWPLAWLWAYSKPVMHKMAYGTDKAEPSHGEKGCGPAMPHRRREQGVLSHGTHSPWHLLVHHLADLLQVQMAAVELRQPGDRGHDPHRGTDAADPAPQHRRALLRRCARRQLRRGHQRARPGHGDRGARSSRTGTIKRGQVLFKLDPRPFEIEVQGFRAQIEALQAQLLDRRRQHRRLQRAAAQRARGARCHRGAAAGWRRNAKRRPASWPPPAPAASTTTSRRRPTCTNLQAQLDAAVATERSGAGQSSARRTPAATRTRSPTSRRRSRRPNRNSPMPNGASSRPSTARPPMAPWWRCRCVPARWRCRCRSRPP